MFTKVCAGDEVRFIWDMFSPFDGKISFRKDKTATVGLGPLGELMVGEACLYREPCAGGVAVDMTDMVKVIRPANQDTELEELRERNKLFIRDLAPLLDVLRGRDDTRPTMQPCQLAAEVIKNLSEELRISNLLKKDLANSVFPLTEFLVDGKYGLPGDSACKLAVMVIRQLEADKAELEQRVENHSLMTEFGGGTIRRLQRENESSALCLSNIHNIALTTDILKTSPKDFQDSIIRALCPRNSGGKP